MKYAISPLLTLIFVSSLHAQFVAPNGAKELPNYRTSWLGNSFGGMKDGKPCWVQQDIAGMCVTADGTVYTNVPWEEAGGNCSMYKDGQMLGAAWHTHGWGYEGGKAVAVNDKYVFIGLRSENEGGGLVDPETWPPKGYEWYGVSRRLRSDFTKGAPFDGGKGGKGDTLPQCFLVVNEVPLDAKNRNAGHIAGLWADEERLYVSNPYKNTVEIYDAESMKKLDTWELPVFEDRTPGTQGDGNLAFDKDGNLWVLIDRSFKALLPERFVVFDKTGKLYEKKLPNGHSRFCPIDIPENHEENFPHNYQPSAFCFDPEGRLLVADSGIFQNIIIFEKNKTDFVTARSFFGSLSEFSRNDSGNSKFKNLPFQFHNITAIGCDANGNLYIANDWATNGGGTILESCAYLRFSRPLRNWRLHGLCFIDGATLDPADENTAYTKEEKFALDWSREPGKEWSFIASTAYRPNLRFKNDSQTNANDMFRDPRLNIGDSAGVWVRNLDDGKFLFVNDMNGQFLQVYRLNNPDTNNGPVRATTLFAPRHINVPANRSGWLPGQPEKGEWIWTNALAHSGQIFMDAKEFESRDGNDAPPAEGWWVDMKGDVWQATLDKGIRRFRFQGLDKIGNPVWNYANMLTYPHPAEFTQVKRIRYDAETDTLTLGGCATVEGVEHKNQHWKPMGPVVCRYDNFLKGNDPGKTEGKLQWKIVLPYVAGSSGHESCEPMGFDIAGDYMFVPYTGASKQSGFKTGHIEVYRLKDGTPAGWIEPDQATVGEIGLQDIRECLSAHRLKSGEYVVFLEDDYKAKVVMFRINLP